MRIAPYFSDIADGPDGSRAFWTTTQDGLNIRVGHFPSSGRRGTVLLFPGRTEFIEKYGRTAQEFSKLGYHTLAIDWRGQGLADRMTDDPMIGHVGSFMDYQMDVDAALDLAQELKLPRPWHLLGHSMGGCIGLRAATRIVGIQSCVFSGPMWGIRISPQVRPLAWTISWGSGLIGFGKVLSPGTSADSYVATEPFEGNKLTTDKDMYKYMQDQLLAEDMFQLGGPSMQWLHEALLECRELASMPSPNMRCLTYLGSDEEIVDTPRIHDRMARWPGGKLEIVPKGRHEVLMEGPAMRAGIAADCVAFFEDHPKQVASLNG